MRNFLENLNKYWATPMIAIVGGLLGLYFTVVKNNLEAEADKLGIAAKKIETDLKQREFQNTLKIQMYGEVKEAISQEDEKLQNAVLLMVNEMLSDDSLFRDKLITILLASPNTDESVKVEQQKLEKKTQEFVQLEKQKTASVFTIDVFYLEDVVAEAEPRAKQIEQLILDHMQGYQVRFRQLPRNINAKSGYRISANEIRYEADEKEIAEKILSLIQEADIFQLEQPRLNQINPNKPTPNYISIFVRNM
ncbi:MAG: hypothetical protein K9G76_05365 [Bacteroidales bacterium]|nr:hypothetical protein [Bacteroidales bacterium]MCF8403108.1 hypothetical protein [Bacteroidales bacterium]